MSLNINKIRELSKSLKQAMHEQCQTALGRLQDDAADPHEVVHEVRKCFKKIRALLRLIRDQVDYYHRENRFFRDEARRISAIRDATSIIEALDLIYDQYGDKIYKNAFSDLRNFLVDKRAEQAQRIFYQEHVLEEIRLNLETQCAALADLPLKVKSFKNIRPGIKRVYKRGRKAGEKAAATEAPEDFHDWRKRVKYLRYQLRVLEPIWPGLLNTWEAELHRLSDFLGISRDLLMLQRFLREHNEALGGRKNTYLIHTLIDGHRSQLQQHAVLLGKRLYHLSPGDFVALLHTAWKAYLKEKEWHLVPPENLEE